MSWTYKGETVKDLTDFPPNSFGFIYVIIHKPTNKKYIGKKVLYYNKKHRIGKRELAQIQGVVGRKPSYRMVVKESDWLTYYGSQKELKTLLAESKQDDFERNIVKIVPNKKLLTYFETKYQMIYEVLEHPEEFFNDNILGKFYTKDFLEIDYENPVEIKKH